MELSQDTQYVLQAIDEASKSTLRKRNDLGSILELGATFGKYNEVSNLIFQGKIIWNLSKQLKKLDSNAEGLNLIQKEFESSLEIFRNDLKNIQNDGNLEIKERFQSVYLEQTKGCVLNIIDLAHDFGKLKDLQDSTKRR
jgi:hypothetical protein